MKQGEQIEGSNVFTKKLLPQRRPNPNIEEDASIAHLLRLRSQKSNAFSSTSIADNSTKNEITNWSFFEKIERLKEKIIDTHKSVRSLENLQIEELLHEAKNSNKNLFQ